MRPTRMQRFKEWLCRQIGHRWTDDGYINVCKRCRHVQKLVGYNAPQHTYSCSIAGYPEHPGGCDCPCHKK